MNKAPLAPNTRYYITSVEGNSIIKVYDNAEDAKRDCKASGFTLDKRGKAFAKYYVTADYCTLIDGKWSDKVLKRDTFYTPRFNYGLRG